MIITRKSPFSGKENSMDLPVTEAQLERWQSGVAAQVAFGNLTADQREFIMTGITPEEWNQTFGSDEDEEFSEHEDDEEEEEEHGYYDR